MDLETAHVVCSKSSDEDARHIFHTAVPVNRDVSVPKDFLSFQLGWQAAPKRATEITGTSQLYPVAPLAAAYLGRQNYKLSGRNSPVQTASSKFAVPIGREGELPWRRL